MDPQLSGLLDRFSTDLRADSSRLPLLYWLRAYTILALAGSTHRLPWSRLAAYVERTAREFNLDGRGDDAGRALLTDYPFFNIYSAAAPDTPLTSPPDGPGHRYSIELAKSFATDLVALDEWTIQTWVEIHHTPLDPHITHILARLAPLGRSALLPILLEAQAANGGWLRPSVLSAIGLALCLPFLDLYRIARSYPRLYTQPVGTRLLRVCDGVSCYLSGSSDLLHKLKNVLWINPGETTPDGVNTLELDPCLGYCAGAPVVEVNGVPHTQVTPENFAAVAGAPLEPSSTAFPGPRLFKQIGSPTPYTLDAYLAAGGFLALRKALYLLSPAELIAEIESSGLVGRGGAGVPTAAKWRAAAAAIASARSYVSSPHPRIRSRGYIVCNAHASDLGSFSDRLLLELNPFQVLEGMLLAARATGARYGFILLRNGFPLTQARLSAALHAARARSLIGPNILDTNFDFDVELVVGAGGYVPGEETALCRALSGERAVPWVPPPFPTEQGILGRPTLVHNAETLAHVPLIISEGAAEFRALGTPTSPGTRLVSLSGPSQRAGAFEVPLGTPLRELVFEYGGGLVPGSTLKAVLAGGAGGSFFTAPELDAPSPNTPTVQHDTSSIIVVDETADFWQVVRRVSRFFELYSCGICESCALGTRRQAELVERHFQDEPPENIRDLLLENAAYTASGSICGLGQTAGSAITSAYSKNLID